jgi:hypothetical protein
VEILQNFHMKICNIFQIYWKSEAINLKNKISETLFLNGK